MTKIDEFDIKLLDILKHNARASTSWLASKLNCSRTKISKRMKKYEKHGIIAFYMCYVNLHICTKGFYAIISLKVDYNLTQNVAQELLRYEEIYTIYQVTGDYDLKVFGLFKNQKEFEYFLTNIIPTVEGIKSTYSRLIMKAYYFGKDVTVTKRPNIKKIGRKAETKLDDVDFKILKTLFLNGRAEGKWIGEQIGNTGQVISSRIKRLTRLGVIRDFITIINGKPLGLPLQASIELTVDPPKFQQVLKKILEMKPKWLDETTGENDLLIFFDLEDQIELRKIIRERISKIEGVQRIDSHVLIKSFVKSL